MSQTLYGDMKDLIWSVETDHQTFPDLIMNLAEFGNDLFDETGIVFTLRNCSETNGLATFKTDIEMRRNLLLIFKEAMNNALKHSKCQETVFQVEMTNSHVLISLRDDGIGLPTPLKRGRGISNMKQRALELNSELKIGSTKQGTNITLRVPYLGD